MRNPLETIDGVYNELLKAEARIAELEKERDQWQESSGQNYVRAQEAEFRLEELEAAATALVEIVDGARWGNWKALPGVRLKDMPEYVALYLAVRK